MMGTPCATTESSPTQPAVVFSPDRNPARSPASSSRVTRGKPDTKHYTLRIPLGADWDPLAALVKDSVPECLASQLGTRFGAVYYRHLAGQPGAFSIAAYDKEGTLAGYLLATLDRGRTRRLTLPLILRLISAANLRLLSPAFFGWLFSGLRKRDPSKDYLLQLTAAELIMFVIAPTFRGEGLAPLLIGEMEAFFTANGLQKPYLILTEKINGAANRFYQKSGAKFIHTYRHHGREINVWHKFIAGFHPPFSSPANERQPSVRL